MALIDKQRGVAAGMGGGFVLAAAGGLVPLLGRTPVAANLNDRVTLWLSAGALLVVWLFVCIARLARHRFFSPTDIDGSGLTAGTERAQFLQSLLQNTLEQTALAFVVHGVWALLAPPSWTGLVFVYALYFSVGRVLFFARYARGAASRALGFSLTFYPTVLMLLAALPMAVWRLCGDWFSGA